MLASSPVTSRRSSGRPSPTPPSAASLASSSGPPGTGKPPCSIPRATCSTGIAWRRTEARTSPTTGNTTRREKCSACVRQRRSTGAPCSTTCEWTTSTSTRRSSPIYEDVDLDWRARLRGWKAHYVPTAVAEHDRGHKGDERRRSALAIRHSLKNRYLMMVRNDRPADALRCSGVILVTEVLRFVNLRGESARARSRAMSDAAGPAPRPGDAPADSARRLIDGPALRRWLEPYPFRRELRQWLRQAPTVGNTRRACDYQCAVALGQRRHGSDDRTASGGDDCRP